jgi:protein-tyrosine phosphatase
LIDLHCHMLPQIDDGSQSWDESLAMAKLAVSEGITVTACTPHIMPGVYDNAGPAIRELVAQLQSALHAAQIPLRVVSGADVHLAPDVVDGLRTGRVLSLGDSRYFLLEPPHNVVPPRFEDFIYQAVSAGYVPLITHPERLKWLETHYAVVKTAVHLGAWTQITAASVVGRFGNRPRYWSKRMLEDGLVHVVASDAHNVRSRPPTLKVAVDLLSESLGEEEAEHLVVTRPAGILDDMKPSAMPMPKPAEREPTRLESFWRLGGRRAGA